MRKYFNIPNVLTSVRILGSLCLLFVLPLSATFFIIYTASGVSDALDGSVARRTKTASTFGARLDSVADIIFYCVMIFKIFPTLLKILPGATWCVVAAAVTFRVFSYITAAMKFRRFASMHTFLNKITGFMIFVVPYFIEFGFASVYCLIVATIGALSSIEELFIHMVSSQYNPGAKAIWMLGKKINVDNKTVK